MADAPVILGRIQNPDNGKNAWVQFPATTEQVQAALKSIGVDGIRHESSHVAEAETSLPGLSRCVSRYGKIDEFNYLASRLQELDPGDLTKFSAILEYDHMYYGDGIPDLINLTYNLDNFRLSPDIVAHSSIGDRWMEENGDMWDGRLQELAQSHNPADRYFAAYVRTLESYVDEPSLGRDMYTELSGGFTSAGLLEVPDDRANTDYYNGWDVPDEYKVFEYPKPEFMKDKPAKQAGREHAKTQPER